MNKGDAVNLNSGCRSAWLSMAVVLFLSPVAVRAETWPVWDPAKLTRLSDLVVVGKMRSNDRIAIHEVLKGKVKAKEIAVVGLDDFVNESPFVPAASKVSLGTDVILFLSQRNHWVRLVANGVYRTGKVNSKGGILGYWQPMSPGRYVLKPEIQFQDLAAVKALIQAELKAIPARQAAAFSKVKAAKTSDEFRQALHELERITRIGDTDILKQIATLDVDGSTRRVHNIFSFIQNVGDTSGAVLLHKLYDKHRDVSILYALGRLGNHESLAYFESLIDKKEVPKPLFALYGMKELYLALEAKGNQKACDMVRDSMYRHVDNDLMNLMMSAPGLVSVIPSQGSINRLRRAYEYHAKRRSNAEYEIEMHIKKCEEKIKALRKESPNKAIEATSQ